MFFLEDDHLLYDGFKMMSRTVQAAAGIQSAEARRSKKPYRVKAMDFVPDPRSVVGDLALRDAHRMGLTRRGKQR